MVVRWRCRIFPFDGKLKKWQGACDVVQMHDCSGHMVMNLALVHVPEAIHHNRARRPNKCTGRELEPKTDKPWKREERKK